MERPSSNLFEGYRSVGYVTGPLPFIVRHAKNPQDTRIITIVDRTFHTYTPNLSLVEVSIPHEYPIRALASDERHIFSTSGRSILSWARGSKALVSRLDNGHQSEVNHIVKFGHSRILTADEDNVLFNWNCKEKEILNIISFDEGNFKITALLHPLNYKDKALLGSRQGSLQLWNIPSEQCLYKFQGWNEPVSCIAQSPLEDVVAIGLEDGHLYILNIKFDDVVMKMYQEYGSVTSMAFRLDGLPYLVTGSEAGHLMVWNLERKRLSAQIRDAHTDRISKCQFLRNEPLLVTSGSDNALKIWSMDSSDGSGNLLSQRCGHSEPPNFVRFYGQKGFNLLSAGKDSTMKMFHMYSERLNRNLGTARINPHKRRKSGSQVKKLPPISCFVAETAKEKQWDNIAACHGGSSLVTTWNYDKCKMGEHQIIQPTFDKHDVATTSICMTACGNFVVIGFSNGLIFKYNMQSGLFRQAYEREELSEHRAHEGPVSGLTVDSLNYMLVSSGSQDASLQLWNFKTGIPIARQQRDSAIIKLELHRESNMLAIAHENNDIAIMDLETRSLVRSFSQNSAVRDMTFSPDSRWLIVAYADKSVRTWDLSLGQQIDAFSLSNVCTSLSISSTGEFLATAHEDSIGINVWCNYTIYCPAPLRPIDESKSPVLLDMPFVRSDEPSQNDEESDEVGEIEKVIDSSPEYVSPEQLSADLITLSGLPASRWRNLLNIEEIRQRQRILEEQERARPIKVPFFIPVKDGLKPKFDNEAIQELNREQPTDGDDQPNQRSTIASKIRPLTMLSPFARCLVECAQTGEYQRYFSQFKELGPSAMDAEIRLLSSDTCGDNVAMLAFLDAIEQGFRMGIDFELMGSWLALFLRVHSSLIQTDREVMGRCWRLAQLVKSKWTRLGDEFNQIFCVLNFVRSSIL